MLNFKNILRLDGEIISSGFHMGNGLFGSPAFFSNKSYGTSAFIATTLTPWCTNNPRTGGCGALFNQIPVTSQTVKISEQDCFINRVKSMEIDNIDQINDISTPDTLIKKVRDQGALLILPNNFKVMDDIAELVNKTIGSFAFSLLHSRNTAEPVGVAKNGNMYYKRVPTHNSSMCINPAFIIVDIKHCLPFYEFNKHTGILVILMSLLYNEATESSNILIHLSFFLSDSDEGLYVMDGDVLIPNKYPITPAYVRDFTSTVKIATFLDKNDKNISKSVISKAKRRATSKTYKKYMSKPAEFPDDMELGVVERVARKYTYEPEIVNSLEEAVRPSEEITQEYVETQGEIVISVPEEVIQEAPMAPPPKRTTIKMTRSSPKPSRNTPQKPYSKRTPKYNAPYGEHGEYGDETPAPAPRKAKISKAPKAALKKRANFEKYTMTSEELQRARKIINSAEIDKLYPIDNPFLEPRKKKAKKVEKKKPVSKKAEKSMKLGPTYPKDHSTWTSVSSSTTSSVASSTTYRIKR